jgi:non-specific serine/threonine protein kinase
MGRYERAGALLEEGLEIERRARNQWRIEGTLVELAHVAVLQNDPHRALALLNECLVIAGELKDRYALVNIYQQMGFCARDLADYPGARRMFDETLALAREVNAPQAIASATFNLGEIARRQDDLTQTVDHYRESLRLYRKIRMVRALPWLLEGFAMVACAQSRWERAATLFGAAEAGRASHNTPLPPNARVEQTPFVDQVRTSLGEVVFATAWAQGAAITMDEILDVRWQI